MYWWKIDQFVNKNFSNSLKARAYRNMYFQTYSSLLFCALITFYLFSNRLQQNINALFLPQRIYTFCFFFCNLYVIFTPIYELKDCWNRARLCQCNLYCASWMRGTNSFMQRPFWMFPDESQCASKIRFRYLWYLVWNKQNNLIRNDKS